MRHQMRKSNENAKARGGGEGGGEGDWTPPTMLNLLLYHWLISFVDLRASSSFYFTAWFSRLRLTLGFKQLIPGWVSPASETETQLNGAGYSTPGSLTLFPAPFSRGWKWGKPSQDSWCEPCEQAAMFTLKAYREGESLTSGRYIGHSKTSMVKLPIRWQVRSQLWPQIHLQDIFRLQFPFRF